MKQRYRRRSLVKKRNVIVVHTRIRPLTTSTNHAMNDSFDRNENLLSCSYSRQSSALSWKSLDSNLKSTKILPNRNLLPKRIEVKHVQKNVSQSKISSTNGTEYTKKTNHRYDSRNFLDQQFEREKRRRNRKCCGFLCCPCSCACAMLSLLAGLLLGMIVAAIILTILPNTKTSRTTTTSTTSTTSTSTTSITTTTSQTTTTTSETTTTTSDTTTTTTTATTTTVILSISLNDTLDGLWNTTAGDDGTLSTPGTGAGNYVATEGPRNAFDKNCSNKYINFGDCYAFAPDTLTCGLKTGFQVTLNNGAIVMKGFRFCTGNDFMLRDPITVTLEGSNTTGSALLSGSVWSLIYSGTSGLNTDPGRGAYGQKVSFSSNMIAYWSYRFLITSKRGADYATQFGDMEIYNS